MVAKPSCARMVATSSSTSSCFMKFCTSSLASVSLLASASDSVITFRSHPVSWLARRMFWPPRPMACESFSSDTAMSMLCESSSTTMDMTSAGDMALITNCAGLSTYGMMSTRSPAISLETACTREPRMPTQAPTGSMRGSLLFTAILARTPGSRAAPRMWMSPCPTSGTSSLKSSIRNSGAVRVDDLGALGFAHLLHDHLLGLLGRDAPEGHRLDRLLDVAAHFRLRVEVQRILEAQLALRDLECLEDHFLVDALLVGYGIDHHQNFFVHCPAYLLRRKPCLADLRERHRHTLTVDLERDAGIVNRQELAGVAPAPGARLAQLHEHPRADEAPEVRLGAQQPVKTRRRHLEGVGAGDRVLDIQQRRHLAAHPLAVLQCDAPVPIDVQPQHRAPVTGDVLELHQLEPQPLEQRLD